MTINLKAAFRETDAFIEDAEPDMEARFATTRSASAQDFAFGKSVWEVVDGNPDGASVSGVAGISLIGSDEVDARGRKKDGDEDGIDYQDVMEAGERLQEEKRRLSVGAISFTAEEVDAIRSIANDPEKLARANQALQDKGYSQEQADFGMHWAMIAAEIAYKEEHGIPLTADEQAQKRQLEEMTPEETAIIQEAGSTMAEVANASRDVTVGAEIQAEKVALASSDANTVISNASTGNTVNDDAVAANIDDEGVWLAAREAQGFDDEEAAALAQRRSSGTLDFAFGDTRSGPVVTPDFNATAAGSQQLAQAQTPSQAGPSSTSEFGLG
ncbi:MAG: hypothetical protein R3E21_01185 [Caenibius sp.]